MASGSKVLIPTGYAERDVKSVSGSGNDLTNADSTTHATYGLKTGSNVTSLVRYKFDFSEIPENATITGVTAAWKTLLSGKSSSYYAVRGVNFIKGDGSVVSLGTISIANAASKATKSISGILREDLTDDTLISVIVRRGTTDTSTAINLYCYGFHLYIAYTYDEPSTDTIYFRDNGAWVEASKAYKKVNGVWVEQTDLTTVFDAGKSWVKG